MTRLLELSPGLIAHASGALWLPEWRVALVADVHLGYGWALRRRGHLGPVGDGGVRERLTQLVAELEPAQLIFLGDLVHAPRPGPQERQAIEEILSELSTRTSLLAVLGNHDRAFDRDFPWLGIPTTDHWETETLLAVHGDRRAEAGNRVLIVGHHHPALCLSDAAGARQKVPVFVATDKAVVLPAFSPFAAGVDIGRGVSAELRQVVGHGAPQLIAATGNRVVRIPARR